MAGVVTTVGKGLVAAAMVVAHVARYVAHGTGTTAPAVTDTALGSPQDLNAGSAWIADTEAVNGSVTYRIVKAMACGSTLAITEVGLFSAANMSSMLYRETFGALNVGAGDTITYTIDITVG